MSISRFGRLSATLAVTALAAAGTFLVASPASAAESLTLANTSYAVGNWGAGISLTGSGYPADAVVTILAAAGPVSDPGATVWGDTTVTADAAGNIVLDAWMPQTLPNAVVAGEVANVIAFSDAIPSEFALVLSELTITPFVALPQALTITPTCVSPEGATADGHSIVGTGFLSEETVLDSTTGPSGEQFGTTDTLVADRSGSVIRSFVLSISGSALPSGTYTEYMVGQTSGVSLSNTFTIGDCSAPAPAPAAVPAAVPAGPQLANTGSGDAGLLAGGAAVLLLAGAVLVVARRRAELAA